MPEVDVNKFFLSSFFFSSLLLLSPSSSSSSSPSESDSASLIVLTVVDLLVLLLATSAPSPSLLPAPSFLSELLLLPLVETTIRDWTRTLPGIILRPGGEDGSKENFIPLTCRNLPSSRG